MRTTLTTMALVAGGALPALAGDTPVERDRAAILAMAGAYTVTFDFKEVVPVQPGYAPRGAYHATADVELVEIIAQEPKRLELQHLLMTDGHVIKHWRQEWIYENRDLYEFAGKDTWKHRRMEAAEAAGTWTQRVTQVDDSPRYDGFGRWSHDGGLSSWESNWTWRPLPRRETTKRDDYQVLVGRNRHTLTHTGWVHEQDNYKLVLGDPDRVLVRELGLNRYDHVDTAKADAARGYWARSAPFWSAVRDAWRAVLVPGATIRIKPEVGELSLQGAMRKLSEAPPADPAELAKKVREGIESYLDDDAKLAQSTTGK